MTRRWLRFLSFAALAPLAVDVPGARQDSSYTSLAIGAGAGSYAVITRGCEGHVINKDPRYFRDVGVAVEHKTNGPLAFGLRQTMLRQMPGYRPDAVLVNPHVSLETRRLGVGAGFIVGIEHDDPDDYDIWPVSGHLRLGSKSSPIHFSIHALEDLPLASGGGALRFGFGLHPVAGLDTWIGMGSPVPYDEFGLVVKTDVKLHRNLSLNLAGRVGISESIKENAGAVGLTFRVPHGR